MKRFLTTALLFSITVFFCGCAGWFQDLRQERELTSSYQVLALKAEKSGQLRQALLYWELVRELNPADEDASNHIAELKALVGQAAATHFKNGTASYEKGLFETARKEFLIALAYDPGRKDALDFLKNRFTYDRYHSYTVEKGDTAETIAKKVYKDPSKAFLVSYFMNLNAAARLRPGALVKLPILDTETAAAPPIDDKVPLDIQDLLDQARALFKDSHYEKALGVTQHILAYDLHNHDAIDLKNASYFQMGKQLELEQDYPGALNMYRQVDPAYEGIDVALSDLKEHMRVQSELHYRNGVKHFVNEELEEAIAEWEKTLAINPGHQKAKADIQKARGLLEKLKKID